MNIIHEYKHFNDLYFLEKQRLRLRLEEIEQSIEKDDDFNRKLRKLDRLQAKLNKTTSAIDAIALDKSINNIKGKPWSKFSDEKPTQ